MFVEILEFEIMRDKQDSQTTDFLLNFHRKSKNIGSEVPSIQDEKKRANKHSVKKKSQPSRNLADLPEDILAIPFKYLLPADIIRCKLVCRRFRSLIVGISIYKILLDSICRRKRINHQRKEVTITRTGFISTPTNSN